MIWFEWLEGCSALIKKKRILNWRCTMKFWRKYLHLLGMYWFDITSTSTYYTCIDFTLHLPQLIAHVIYCFLLTLFQSVTGEEVTQEELGGAKTHTATSGENLFSICYDALTSGILYRNYWVRDIDLKVFNHSLFKTRGPKMP